ncbi:MAG: dienelactone hydrolase family protein [Kofleriaceae bacterium]
MKTEIRIPIDGIELEGSLVIPGRATGLVIFAHGSGSSRHSPRNSRVATILERHGLGTLLFDLLTVEEERIDSVDTTLRFDVDTLAERLLAATDSLIENGQTRGLPIAYFGGSTGAAAALIAAARRPGRIAAIVSRGGRPDLAGTILEQVTAPTLLIAGSRDTGVLAANREAAARLAGPHRVEVIPGATHWFDEPGALDQVAELAAAWFIEHFAAHHRATRSAPTSATH